MAGNTNFPTALDNDSSLYDVTDGISSLVSAHHNNLKEAIKAIETKVGIYATDVATTLDARFGHPTHGHAHEGASGYGRRINATAILVPSGGVPSGGSSLHDHLMDKGVHNPSGGIQGTGIASSVGTNILFAPSAAIMRATGIASVVSQSGATVLLFVPTIVPRFVSHGYMLGSAVVGTNKGFAFSIGRTLQIDNVRANLRVGASGATAAFDVNVGPTSIWEASQLNRPIFPAGATQYGHASPNLVTYPSGSVITIDVDAVGSNDPGQDLAVTFIFKE